MPCFVLFSAWVVGKEKTRQRARNMGKDRNKALDIAWWQWGDKGDDVGHGE